MRVAILTLHRAINPGAVLQAYALQKKIEESGNECYILDYRPHDLEKAYAPVYLGNGNMKNRFRNFISTGLRWRSRYVARKEYAFFIDEKLKTSEVLKRKDLQLVEKQYDMFITGSDQVWNFNVIHGDESYFLDFVHINAKKVSYAASIGDYQIAKNRAEDYKRLLGDFKKISVRERSAAEFLKDLLGIQATVNIDPTLLLNGEQWRQLEKKESMIMEDYIFVYRVTKPQKMYKYAQYLSEKTGYKVVCLNATPSERMAYKQFEHIGHASPDQFITLIDNAKCVITTSFHGMAFALNLHTPFAIEIKNAENENTRARDLIMELGLQLQDLENICNQNVVEMTIDWKKVDEKLEKLRQKSQRDLNELLKGDK